MNQNSISTYFIGVATGITVGIALAFLKGEPIFNRFSNGNSNEESLPVATLSDREQQETPATIDHSLPLPQPHGSSLIGKTVIATGSGRCVELPSNTKVFENRSINLDCGLTPSEHAHVENGHELEIIWSPPTGNRLHVVLFKKSQTVGWISESNFQFK